MTFTKLLDVLRTKSLTFVVLYFSYGFALAQTCSSTDIDLFDQKAIDNFQVTYGPCTHVTGLLRIWDVSEGAPIASLSPLAAI